MIGVKVTPKQRKRLEEIQKELKEKEGKNYSLAKLVVMGYLKKIRDGEI